MKQIPIIEVLRHPRAGQAYFYHLAQVEREYASCHSIEDLLFAEAIEEALLDPFMHYALNDVALTQMMHDLLGTRGKPKVDRKRYTSKAPKGRFKWLTHQGDLVDPRDMATPHLFYALRMIYNHTAPEEFRTPALSDTELRNGGPRRYSDVPQWSPAYCAAAVKALSTELNSRNPKGLLPGMEDQIRWMWMGSVAMAGLGIKS